MEDKIGNAKKPLFYGTELDRVYCSAFGDINNDYNSMLLYGKDIQDQKEVEVKKAYIEALYNYIGSKVVVTGKYSIPVIAWVKHRKRYASGNHIGEEHSEPIINTRVYKLELPKVIVDKYAVNIIIDNLNEKVDGKGWDTIILENIVAFCLDLDVDITKWEQEYTYANGIQRLVITTQGWYVHVKWRDTITDFVILRLIKESNTIEV